MEVTTGVSRAHIRGNDPTVTVTERGTSKCSISNATGGFFPPVHSEDINKLDAHRSQRTTEAVKLVRAQSLFNPKSKAMFRT